MADRNNLVLTVVIVAAALLFFNGGLTGNAVSSYYERSSGSDGTFCVYGNVVEYSNGVQTLVDICGKNQQCVSNKDSRTAFCITSVMPGTSSYSYKW